MAEASGDRLLIRTYVGRDLASLVESYWRETQELSADGYEPVGQIFVDGQWTWVDVLLSLVTIPLIIGIFLTIRLFAYRPTGSLIVTYAQR
jgi:hypothetical protein